MRNRVAIGELAWLVIAAVCSVGHANASTLPICAGVDFAVQETQSDCVVTQSSFSRVIVTSSFLADPIFVNTPVNQTTNQYQTTITALLNGGTTLFEETLSAPLSDPSVQNAIAQADALFTTDGASFGSPQLTNNSTVLESSLLSYVATSPSPSLSTLLGCGPMFDTTGTETCAGITVNYAASNGVVTFGPATIMIGPNDSDQFAVEAGQEDINVTETFSYNVDQNAVTTNTYLTTQSYVIDGMTQGTASAVPEPATAGLVLIGLGAAACWRKRCTATALLVVAAAACVHAGTPSPISKSYGKLPLSFEPNRGQTSTRVQWLARGPEYTIYFAGSDAVLQISSSAVRMRLLGAKPAQQTSGEDPQPGKANYFGGKDPAKWQHNVPMFGKVRMSAVYPGVDLLYYGRQGLLEYDLVLAPGADASAIRLQFDGAKPSLAANGDLVLPVEGGPEVRFTKPVVYQTKDGVRQPVEGGFAINRKGQVSFHLGPYDHSRELVIDPTLDFLGVLGTGSFGTAPNGMTVDALGEMILTGYTYDLDFPATPGAYQTTCGSTGGNSVRCGSNRSNNFSSAFVAKISADGTSLIYATYLHGLSGYESGASVAADAAGDAYVLGSTTSNDFPITADAYQTLCNPFYQQIGVAGGATSEFYPIAATCYGGGGSGGPSLFISKLNATGSSLLYSTFFGGTAATYPVAIALDSLNNIYFASQLSEAPPDSAYYPNGTLVPFPTAPPNAPGPAGSLYKPTGPMNAAYQPFGGGYWPVATLSELSADGHTLLYSTLVDGLNAAAYRPATTPQALAVGPNGIAYIGGSTNESGFPVTPGAVKGSCVVSSGDSANCVGPTGFLSAFDTTKSGAASLVYSTFIGGTDVGGNYPQRVLGLAADSSNNVYVTGNTQATDYPTTADAYQSTCTFQPGSVCRITAFLSKINPTGTAYIWSTLYGGNNVAVTGEAIALDEQGRVYLYGLDASGYGVFVNPIQPPEYGSDKAFIAAFSADGSQLEFATQVGSTSTTTNENDEPIPSNGLAVDSVGNMYFAGSSADDGRFKPTEGSYATPAVSGGNRAFFGKISCLSAPCPALAPLPSNSIVLVVGPPTTSVGQTVTMTATVTGQQGQPEPAGLVAFYNNGSTWLGQATLNASGIAMFSSSTLPAGVYAVTAVYLGDHLYPGATSTSQSLTILSGPAATTTTASNAAITYSAGPQQVTLTATVTSAAGVVNTGSVLFSLTGVLYQQPPSAPVHNGTASVTITLQPAPLAPHVGSYAIGTTYTDTSSTFATSSDSTKQLTVSIATPVITWPNPAGIPTGTALGSAQLNATANTPGTFVYNPLSGTALPSGSGQTLSTTFTPTDSTDYTNATATVTINVGGSNSTTTVASNASVAFSQSTQTVALTADVTSGSGVVNSGSVTFSVAFPNVSPYTASAPIVNGVASASFAVPAGNFLGVPGSYPISATYVPSGNLAGSTDNTKKLTISKAPLVITWATPAPIANGTPLEFGQLNATASPGSAFPTCAYTPPLGTVLSGPSTDTLSVTCTPATGYLADYSPATTTISIQVLGPSQGAPTITWAQPAPVAKGTALSSTQLDARANVPGTFTYTPPLGTVLSTIGTQTLSVTFTPANTTAYSVTTASVTIQVLSVVKVTPTITWPIPAAITTGTALSATQLNASATAGGLFPIPVPGTFVYTPPAGTVLPVGNNQVLSVTFTPTDTTSYNTATAKVYLNVNSTAISVAVETDIVPFNTSPTSTTLTANVINASSTAYVGFTVLGTATSLAKVANGVATAIVTVPANTPSGLYPIVANYSDPSNPGFTTSGTANLVVSPPKVTITTTNVTVNYSSSAPVVTLTAMVANASPTGVVDFTSPAGTASGIVHVINGVASVSFTISAGTAAGTYPINITYTDSLNLSAIATATASLTITRLATPIITWPTPGAIFNGTPLSSTQLNATASVPGTGIYNPEFGTVLPVGNGQVLSLTFTPTDSTRYTTATASVQINVIPAVTVAVQSVSIASATVVEQISLSASLTNSALPGAYSLTFSLLGSTVSAPTLPQSFSIPAGTPVGTYPIVATYVDLSTGLTTSGTGQLTITPNPCPTTAAVANFAIHGESSVVKITRLRGPHEDKNKPHGPTPDAIMISGGPITVGVNDGSGGGNLVTLPIVFPPQVPPLPTMTTGPVRVVVSGDQYVSELAGGTGILPSTVISACVYSIEQLPVVMPVTPLSTLTQIIPAGTPVVVNVSTTLTDPVSQAQFGVEITQRTVVQP